MSDIEWVIISLNEFFKEDEAKIAAWLDTANPFLGQTRPLDMIMVGRIGKLRKFMESKLKEKKED